MIKQIRQIGSSSRAIASSFHVKKRAKDFFTYLTLGTAGTIASWNMSKVITQPMVDEFVAMRPKVIAIQPAPKVKRLSTETLHLKFNWAQQQSKTKLFFENLYPFKKHAESELEKQTKVVLKIMDEDANCPYVIDRAQLAKNIVMVANKYGVDPIEIACIVKKESHFKGAVNGQTGKGLMQLTGYPVKDMYQQGRDTLYSSKINELKKIYPDSSSLYYAVSSNDNVNLNVGTVLYLFHLKNSGGDVYKALNSYNGGGQKSYAGSVYREISKYKKAYEKMKAV